MLKYFLMITTLLMFAGMGLADPHVPYPHGPAPQGGWGHDCTNWSATLDPFAPHTACLTLDGTFLDCETGGPALWPGLELEAWVEATCTYSWDATAAQFHIGNTEAPGDMCVVFHGSNSCNIPVGIRTSAAPGFRLDQLPYTSGIDGWNMGDQDQTLELTWRYRYTLPNGDWSPWTPYTNIGPDWAWIQFNLEECIHEIEIECCVHWVFHQTAGYYHMPPGGSICPASPM